MARKKDVVKKIDQKTSSVGAPLPLMQEDQPAAPAFALIPAPDTLILLGQAIQRSTQAPLVQVAISWQEAPNIAPDYYNVDYSEYADFTNSQRRRALTTSATIDGLKANGVTYYFRVQAVVSGIYSPFTDTLPVVTMADTTPPPDVTGASAAFQNSDLVITYTIPTSEILKDVEIKIYNAAHTILYGTFYPTTNRFVWTAEQNIFATGGTPLKSVSVDIHTRSWTNQPSTTGVNVTATAPLPSTPTGYISNWISDNGTASADFVTSWLGAANANDYEITIDGRVFYTRDLKFVYSYEQNVSDHKPTVPSGSPSFIWLLKSRDKLGQSSTPVNVTVANAAPPSGVMSMSITPGFSTIGVTVGLLANTIVQDFDHYEWALTSGSTTVQSFNSVDSSVIFQANAAGTYIPTVRMVDKFNQKSAVVSGAPTVLDTLTIDQLRAETQYQDWLGTSAAVLARLKDGVLYDGSGAYQFYAANAGWQWLEAYRPLLDRYKTITFSAFWGAGLSIYYEVDTPNGLVYYAGPVTVSANGDYVMTRYTSQATAQTNAYAFVTAGNGTRRFDFTRIEESRRIRLYFKDTASTTGIYEYYPRRLIQSDDIEAETIRSINVAALGINADRIFAVTLSAFTASMGSLHIDSLLDIASTGIIFQGTGSGTLVQNATTPTSFGVTGLKIYQVSGVGRLATYNAGVEQIALDTDGRFKAGAGSVIIDASGIRIVTPATATYTSVSSIDFIDTGGNRASSVRAYNFSGSNQLTLESTLAGGRYGSIDLIANGSYHTASMGVQGINTSLGLSRGDMSADRIEIRSTISTYSGFEGILLFAHATNTLPDVWLSLNNLAVNVPAYMSDVNADNMTALSLTSTGTITGNKFTASNGTSVFGNQAVDYLPTTGNWSSGGTTLLVQGNDFSSIGFHDSGSRVDFIVGGAGIIRVGYDGGWGPAVVTMPGGARIGPTGVYIGSTLTVPSYLIELSANSAGKPSTNTWTVSSDKRSKKDIKLFDHGLDDLREFPLPVSFKYNGLYGTPDDDIENIGYIAQDVQKIAPKMVTITMRKATEDQEPSEYLSINTGAMQMMFHRSIIEVDDRVIALEKRIKELEAKLKV